MSASQIAHLCIPITILKLRFWNVQNTLTLFDRCLTCLFVFFQLLCAQQLTVDQPTNNHHQDRKPFLIFTHR